MAQALNHVKALIIVNTLIKVKALIMAQALIIVNALNHAFHEDPNVGLVIIKGNHKAFCAGGDVVYLTSAFASGKIDHNKIFIQLMHTVHSFSKPYVAIIDGITMGGGCGLALNGEKFVIATERTMVAMPETYIGYYPDSGAAHFFKGNLGMFLGLTGFRLKGADVFHTGQLQRSPNLGTPSVEFVNK
uniref:3-hydroxyisobutyryl-CoA hydrolase, mitochondrial n=1 Tax=Acrobeloides nanus TaxID=290746 RepID=A0A914C7Q6_9BILA